MNKHDLYMYSVLNGIYINGLGLKMEAKVKVILQTESFQLA